MATKKSTALTTRARTVEKAIDAELEWERKHRKEGEWRFANLARRLAEFEDNEFWRTAGYKSMNAFLEAKAEKYEQKRETMYGALWVGQKIAPHLTDDEMRKIGKSKLYILAYRTEKGAKPPRKLLGPAKDSKVKVDDFRALARKEDKLLKGEKPEDLDQVEVKGFWIKRQDRDFVNKVFDLGRRVEGIDSRDRLFVLAIQAAHVHWLDEERAQKEAA